MNGKKCMVLKSAVGLMILVVLLVSGPACAAGTGATQGSVAINLASLLGLNLPTGATGQEAINALSAQGIVPASGWNEGAAADSNFIASLYSAVLAAFNSRSASPSGALNTPAGIVAAACTASNINQTEVVKAIKGAGGNGGDATQGATFGGGFVPGGNRGPTYFAPYFDGSRPGTGGGGGAVNPSPNS